MQPSVFNAVHPVKSAWRPGQGAFHLAIVGLGISIVLMAAVARVPSPQTESALIRAQAQHQLLAVTDLLRLAGSGMALPRLAGGSQDDDPCLPAWLGRTGPQDGPLWSVPLQGWREGDAIPSCLPERMPGTDAVVVRRLATAQQDWQQIRPGSFYVQVSVCAADQRPWVLGDTAAALSLRGADCRSPAPVRAVDVQWFYVRRCTNCGPQAASTLVRRALQGRGWSETPLLQGVEDLRVDYGFDRDGDGQSDLWARGPQSAGAADATWQQVAALRITLRLRTPAPQWGWSDRARYPMGLAGEVGPFNDGWSRLVLTQRVALAFAGRPVVSSD